LFSLQAFCGAPRILHAVCTAEHLVESHRRLGRHSRRLAARGVQFKQRNGNDSALVREIYLKKATQEGSLFADSLRRDFMEHICREEGNRCRIYTYESQTDLVAAIVTLGSHRARHFYTVYFDPQWAAFSPGQVLLYESSVRVLAENVDCDFLTGEYPYKTRLATTSVPLLRLQASADELREALDRHQANIAA
jgi:CelD/BcsL family acetyltransferase involved in cellulose biosynthesis